MSDVRNLPPVPSGAPLIAHLVPVQATSSTAISRYRVWFLGFIHLKQLQDKWNLWFNCTYILINVMRLCMPLNDASSKSSVISASQFRRSLYECGGVCWCHLSTAIWGVFYFGAQSLTVFLLDTLPKRRTIVFITLSCLKHPLFFNMSLCPSVRICV